MIFTNSIFEDFDQYPLDATVPPIRRLSTTPNWVMGGGDVDCFIVQNNAVLSGFNTLSIYSPLTPAWSEIDRISSQASADWMLKVYHQVTADAYTQVQGKGYWIGVGAQTSAAYPASLAIYKDEVAVLDNGGTTLLGFNPGVTTHEYKITGDAAGVITVDIDGSNEFTGTSILAPGALIDVVYIGHDSDNAKKLVGYTKYIELYAGAASGWNIARTFIGG